LTYSDDYRLSANVVNRSDGNYQLIIDDSGSTSFYYLKDFDALTSSITYIPSGRYAESFLVVYRPVATIVTTLILSKTGERVGGADLLNGKDLVNIYSKVEGGVDIYGNPIVINNGLIHIFRDNQIQSYNFLDSNGDIINGYNYKIVSNQLGFSVIWQDYSKTYFQNYDPFGNLTSSTISKSNAEQINNITDVINTNSNYSIITESAKTSSTSQATLKLTVSDFTNDLFSEISVPNGHQFIDVDYSSATKKIVITTVDSNFIVNLWELSSSKDLVRIDASVSNYDIFSISENGYISPNLDMAQPVRLKTTSGSEILKMISTSFLENNEIAFSDTLSMQRTFSKISNATVEHASAQAVDISDVISQLRHIVGLSELTGLNKAAADNDANGSVDISDVISSLRQIVGLEAAPNARIVDAQGNAEFMFDDSITELYVVAAGDADLSWTPLELV